MNASEPEHCLSAATEPSVFSPTALHGTSGSYHPEHWTPRPPSRDYRAGEGGDYRQLEAGDYRKVEGYDYREGKRGDYRGGGS